MKRLALTSTLLLSLLAWAQSQFDGTWKVDLAKAQFSQKADVFLLENGRYSCPTCTVHIDVTADGTDQKVLGAIGWDTLAVKELSDKVVRLTRKKAGKVTTENMITVSEDGQTLTSEFKDYGLPGQPATGKVLMTRVSPGPAGSHAMSGSWRSQKLENQAGFIFMFKGTADSMTMNTPGGVSYEAKFDGKDYPVRGDRADKTVSLKKVNDSTFEETYKVNGRIIYVNRIAARGSSLLLTTTNVVRGMTDKFTLNKQ